MPRTWLKERQWVTVTKQHNNTDEIITKNKYLIIFLSYYQQQGMNGILSLYYYHPYVNVLWKIMI
jgi:hypothetical protein